MFSVIIPVYNHGRFIAGAITSALQSKHVQEVLIVDDGSHDNSRDVIKYFETAEPKRIRNLTDRSGDNIGTHARLNQLVEASHCEWIAVLNSTDRFTADRFEILSQKVRLHDPDFLFGQLLIMDEQGRCIGTKRGPSEPKYPYPSEFNVNNLINGIDYFPLIANQNFITTTSNMVFKKAVHKAIGGFADFRYVHDWDFAARAILRFHSMYVESYLSIYRSHPSNTISEPIAKIDDETTDMFDAIISEFPDILLKDHVVAALEGNEHYTP